MLINGTLTNAEIWYNLSKSEVEEFEALDRLFFRRLMEVPATTPCEAYYLEFGVLPIGALLKARRINYLQCIVKQEEKGMLYSFLITQWNNPTKGDWTEQVKKDLEDFEIPCSFELMKQKSKETFKKMVKVRAKEYALKVLLSKKGTKMEKLQYSDLTIQNYLVNEETTINQKKTLFKYRVRMERFGGEFPMP